MTTLTTSIEINAPIELVWNVLTDFSKYTDWNRFTPIVETSGRLGDGVTLHVNLSSGNKLTKSQLIIEQFEPYTLCWGDDNLFVKAHRTQTLEQLGPTKTLYQSVEPFAGLIKPIIMLAYKDKLMRGYQWAAEGLKAESERLFAQKTEADGSANFDPSIIQPQPPSTDLNQSA